MLPQENVRLTEVEEPAEKDQDLWTKKQVCEFFGGKDTPIHPSTLHRGMKARIYPPPFNAGPGGLLRWLPSKCRKARQALILGRKSA